MSQRVRPAALISCLHVLALLNFAAYDASTTAVAFEGRVSSQPDVQAFDVRYGVRQLFLDDLGIETLDGLKRVVHR